jgi:hypothetical protein
MIVDVYVESSDGLAMAESLPAAVAYRAITHWSESLSEGEWVIFRVLDHLTEPDAIEQVRR